MFDVLLFVAVWGLFGFKMAALPIALLTVFAIVFAYKLLMFVAGLVCGMLLAAATWWRRR